MGIRLSEADKIKILNSMDIYGIMQRILLRENKIDRNREHLWVVGLANNNRLLFVELVSKGTSNKTLVEPMEVFSFALQKRALSIILVHNHPGGELNPSENDKDITDRLIQVGIIVETQVFDHLIITEKDYYSFADSGLLDKLKLSTKYVPPYVLQQRMKEEAKMIGIKSGKEEKAREMAIIMKEAGEPVEKIALFTGLSVEDIEGI